MIRPMHSPADQTLHSSVQAALEHAVREAQEAQAEALCNMRDQDPNDDAAFQAALREAEEISPDDLLAAAKLFDRLT